MRQAPTYQYRVHAKFSDNGLEYGLSIDAVPQRFFDKWDGSREPKEILIISPEMADVIMCRGFFSVPVNYMEGAVLYDNPIAVRGFAYAALHIQKKLYPSLIAFVATYNLIGYDVKPSKLGNVPRGNAIFMSVIFGTEPDAVQYALDTGESGDIMNRKNGRW